MLTVGQDIAGLDLRELAEVKPSGFVLRLFILITVTSVLIALTVMASGPLFLIPAVLLGLMYAHAVELEHQALHNTAFQSKQMNRFFGVLLGMPLLVSYSDYQHSHFRHHRLLGTPEDKEFFNYGYGALTTLGSLIPHLFMVRHYRDVARYMVQALFGGFSRDANEKTTQKIRTEYRLFGLFLFAMAAITVIFQTTLFLKIWLIPLFIGVPAHALIELPEHIGCNTSTTDVLKNTRSIRTSWFGSWYTNGNNYHVEHHWLPGVPNHRWPELHARIAKDIENLEISYWSFYSGFLKLLYQNTFKRP